MPIPAIVTGIQIALPLFKSAVDIFMSFKGSAKQAKVNTQVQDAMGVATALFPLIEGFFTKGTTVTPEQVKAALSNFDAALAAADAEIDRLEKLQ